MQLAALAVAALATAGASVSSPPDNMPAVFQDYGHPAITAADCQNEGPSKTTCTIPGKTMGRYSIVVQGTSSAKGANSNQEIAIGGRGWQCGPVATQKGQWTGKRTFVASCVITVLSDAPLTVVGAFGGADVTLDPAGPQVTVRSAPWNGVLEVGGIQAALKAPVKAAK